MEKNLMNLMASEKRTENGAYAKNTTFDAVVDLFAVAGALRYRDNEDIISMWEKAYAESPELAFRMIFYIRNVRGGLGERNTFRTLVKYVANTYPSFVCANLENVVFYGRFDDLFILFDTPVEDAMVEFVHNQLKDDIANMNQGKSISLLAKWMPSNNTSSQNTVMLANRFIKAFGMSASSYRKTLSALRKYSNVTEVKMSANDWVNINYPMVSSNAMTKYYNAFYKRDENRFKEYLDDVKSGKTEIKAGTLYPYDLVHKYMGYSSRKEDTVELQWKNLPDYFNGETFNALVMADVSSSMSGRPMETSVGLAIYFAEHNKGAFANSYMTFTATPEIRTIRPNMSLYEKVKDVMNHGVGYDTNLEKAFMKVLNTATNNNLSQDDMPESIIVISDMEINSFGEDTTFLDAMKTRFENAGYKLPKLVWWNVNARNNTFHADASDDAQFISGSSVSAFESLISGKTLSAIELVEQTLSAYDRVVIPSKAA